MFFFTLFIRIKLGDDVPSITMSVNPYFTFKRYTYIWEVSAQFINSSEVFVTWEQYRSWEDGCDGSIHGELCPRPVSPRHWHWHLPRLLLCSPQGREVWTEQEMISLIAITGNKRDAITSLSLDAAARHSASQLYLSRYLSLKLKCSWDGMTTIIIWIDSHKDWIAFYLSIIFRC